jgi:hypothetical protein
MAYLKILSPIISVIRKPTKKMKNKTLAMAAAPEAMPPKPNIAAIIAMTKKIAAHFSISVVFLSF